MKRAEAHVFSGPPPSEGNGLDPQTPAPLPHWATADADLGILPC